MISKEETEKKLLKIFYDVKFFKNTGIILPEETLKEYAKFTLNDNVVKATNFSQYSIAFLILLTWFSFISTQI